MTPRDLRLTLDVLCFLFFSLLFRRSVAELLEEEELSLSLSLLEWEDKEKEADRLMPSSVSQLGPGVWYRDGWLGAARVRAEGGPGGLDEGLKDVVDDGLDGFGAIGPLSGVKMVIHDFTEVGIWGFGGWVILYML
jgi:hypothetical protein